MPELLRVMSTAEKPVSRVRWFLVAWIFVLSAVSYLDRVNISIAGSSIAAEFGLNTVQLGTVFSAFLFGYALFQTAGGWLADRYGPRRVLTAGALWWGAFTSLTALVSPRLVFALFVLVGVRFLLGAGEAVMFPASNQFVSRWIPQREQGIANGVVFAGVGVGASITPAMITYVMIHYGWRWSFWMSAFLGVLAGLVWYVVARDTPEQHPMVSPRELANIRGSANQIMDSAASASSGPIAKPETVSWSTILGSKEVWAITWAYFSYGYVAWIFFAWFFIYLAKVRGLNLRSSAFYTTLPFIAMAICSLLGGAISDRMVQRYGPRVGRCSIAVFGLALSSIFLVLGARSEQPRVAGVVLAGGAGALYLAQSSFWSVTAAISRGSSGSVSGFMNSGNQFGGMLTAQLTPIIALRWNWSASFYVAAVFALLGACAWLFVDPAKTLAAKSAAVKSGPLAV
jgi:MFS transporter, ACS family, glucarate transporter